MDILLDLVISAPPERIFKAITEPAGLAAWWAVRCEGSPEPGGSYTLWFGEGFDWRARVTRAEPGRAFELELTAAQPDWLGTRVGFELTPVPGGTHLRFHHLGWAAATDHFRTSAFCWAQYLRLLGRYVVHGEVVPYTDRNEL